MVHRQTCRQNRLRHKAITSCIELIVSSVLQTLRVLFKNLKTQNCVSCTHFPVSYEDNEGFSGRNTQYIILLARLTVVRKQGHVSFGVSIGKMTLLSPAM